MQGFLPFSRASLVMDAVFIVVLALIPILSFSIYLVKVRKQYAIHKKIQIILSVILFIALITFECEVRIRGWDEQAKVSPFYNTWLFPFLYLHLCFAITTTVLWYYTLLKALKNFSQLPIPNQYSPRHKRLAKWTAAMMYITAISGSTFFYMAFMA